MTRMPEFKYDVAFSFLGRDEPLARKLNDILADRLKTFIYSDKGRQAMLAGRDGEGAFARIFGDEARTVVVLYREGWGEQGFTAAESTGIRNRASERGFQFTTFIPLDNPPVAPRLAPAGAVVVRAREVWAGRSCRRHRIQGARSRRNSAAGDC